MQLLAWLLASLLPLFICIISPAPASLQKGIAYLMHLLSPAIMCFLI